MATSSSQRSGSNRNRNRNRRKSGGGRSGNNRNRQGSGGYIRSKVPRKAPEPSFGQKLLKILSFGLLGGKVPDGPKKPGPAKRGNDSLNSDRNSHRNSRNESGERKCQNNGSERQSHTPELVEVTSGRLYVGNLSYDAAESDLIDLFNGVGAVSSAEVVSHRRTQRSKGYAFIVMNSVDEAKRAVEVLHDKDFMGRKLVVSGAKSPGVRSGESSESGDTDLSDPSERPTYGE